MNVPHAKGGCGRVGGDWWVQDGNAGSWLLKGAGSFQGKELRWPGHHDGEKVRST